ncbi:MAG: M81 family metallopeptidase, partial [Pseudomonadota bacterium]
MRIAVAGLLHETNTFANGTTTLADFEAPGGWPALARGDALVTELAGTAAPMAGALQTLERAGGTPVGILWALALPSGQVEHDAFETFCAEITARLTAAHREAPLDGVYLDLHGAMVTTKCADGEGEILARVRHVVGEAVPIAASLDAHANVSPRMVAVADTLDVYRTYPHVDMTETGSRAMERLLTMTAQAKRPAKAFRPVPFLTSIVTQSTLDEPTAGLVVDALTLPRDTTGGALSAAFGFPLADVVDAGPSIIAYADTTRDADTLADALLEKWCAAEAAFGAELLDPDVAVARAQAIGRERGGQVVIADAQD